MCKCVAIPQGFFAHTKWGTCEHNQIRGKSGLIKKQQWQVHVDVTIPRERACVSMCIVGSLWVLWLASKGWELCMIESSASHPMVESLLADRSYFLSHK